MNPPMQSMLVRNTKPTETASWSSSYNGNRLAISESDLSSSATNKRRQHNANVHWGRIFVSHVSVSASLFGVYDHFIWRYSPCRGSFMWQCCHFNLISCVKYNHPVSPSMCDVPLRSGIPEPAQLCYVATFLAARSVREIIWNQRLGGRWGNWKENSQFERHLPFW